MKTTKQKLYEAPKAEIILIETQGVLCASEPSASVSTGAGGGTTNMNIQDGYGW